jgi:hypothetical protein
VAHITAAFFGVGPHQFFSAYERDHIRHALMCPGIAKAVERLAEAIEISVARALALWHGDFLSNPAIPGILDARLAWHDPAFLSG